MDKKWREAVIEMDSPAQRWQEGSPLGNGRMGAMVYGGTAKDIIDLSELTFFSGCGEEEEASCRQEAFRAMRREAMAGRYDLAEEAGRRFVGARGNYGTNLPAGKLYIEHLGTDRTETYKRELNLNQGLLHTWFVKAGTGEEIGCEYLLSHPDSLLAIRIRSNRAGSGHYRIWYENPDRNFTTDSREDTLVFTTRAIEETHSDGLRGVNLAGAVRAVSDGQVTVRDHEVRVEGASDTMVYAAWKTDFETQETLEKILSEELLQKVSRTQEDYEKVKYAHVRDVREKMDRVELTLDGGGEERKTELMFQFGRYLLLCSSREDSPLPAHLQGVWNDDVACRIGWTCDMHLDVNTQMNYWISETGNLQECHKPLFRWMEDAVLPKGRKSARTFYGLPGWEAELVSNAWGYTSPYWHISLSPCPACGIWQASHYMEHYRHTMDRVFLRSHALPVLREAVEFFMAYLTEDRNNRLSAGPSISPENGFLVGDRMYYLSMNPTFEVLMIRQLFEDYMECTGELGLEEDQQVRKAVGRLLDYRILPDGTLAEWEHDYPAADRQHRHTSHLLGVFPYHQITPEDTPGLAQAAYETIRQKQEPEEGWEDTGWARNMLILYLARLKKGEEAFCNLQQLQQKLTHKNLLVMHPPTRGAGAFQEVYELDGNTGMSMCVAEMLMQSHNNTICLLPAIPGAWKSGQIRGLVAEGGVEMDIAWQEDQVTATAKAKEAGEYRFLCRGSELTRICGPGEEISILFR